jgi:signal transduction histidine kinase/AmiR/NasT family two-component response regulator
MSHQADIHQASSHAPFQARIASVALITTVAVLLAACATFMLQQWAVSRQESRAVNAAMNAVVAEIAAPAMARGDETLARGAVESMIDAPGVRSASLVDSKGRILAVHREPGSGSGAETIIRTPVVLDGRTVGTLVTTVESPRLAALLPRYLALTFALFFGAAGIAMFVANTLARRVTQPVNRLSIAMGEVAESGRFTPVDENADDDLFRSLARSFNQLLAKLDANDRELRRAMAELVEARDMANAANVLKSQFLANMSHEIRTPLNGVLAMADVMARGDLDGRQRERLGVIRESGELLLSVINDVLDLSKIEAGRLELAEHDFSLDEMAETALSGFSVLAGQKNLRFGMTVDSDAAGWWRGDSDRIRQILSNLLSNAVKFTAEGAVAARFSRSPSGGLRLTVSDTGIGISGEKLPTLFEKFIQADNSTTRRFGGTGLGLAICRELAQLMGGTVFARSIEGEGSTFTVELPLQRAAMPTEQTAPASALDALEERRLRILAAEDNATNQKVLQAVMEPLDVHLHIVPDGKQAVEAWREGGFDLILMDVQMPVMDGVEAARTIRAAEAALGSARIPILALTANALVHQVESYLEAGMDGHVSKPIELTRLYDAIETALSSTAAARAEAAAA